MLNSYWNDPIEPTVGNWRGQVQILGLAGEEEMVRVIVNTGSANSQISFVALGPVVMYSRAQDCHMDAREVGLAIQGSTGGASYFRFRGINSLVCGELSYACESANLDGSLWLDPSHVSVVATRPTITEEEGSEYGWGDSLKGSPPWRMLDDPQLRRSQNTNRLLALIDDCASRIATQHIVVESSYEIPEGPKEREFRWAVKDYGDVFTDFLKLLKDNGLAKTSRIAAAGKPKFRVMLPQTTQWKQLSDAVRARIAGVPENNDDVREFLDGCAKHGGFGL